MMRRIWITIAVALLLSLALLASGSFASKRGSISPQSNLPGELTSETQRDPVCPEGFLVGDADGSGSYDIDDVTVPIPYIMGWGPPPRPCSITSGDANCSGAVDIDDVVFMIAFIFSGGPAPCSCEVWVAIYGDPCCPDGCQYNR
jgi:hypothetical protein